MSFEAWLNWKSYVEFESANSFANTPFQWNCFTHKNIYIKFQTSIMCLSIALYLYLDCFVCAIDVQLESEATPFVEDTVIEPRQQGKQPPFDHVDKNPFPSLSLMHD